MFPVCVLFQGAQHNELSSKHINKYYPHPLIPHRTPTAGGKQKPSVACVSSCSQLSTVTNSPTSLDEVSQIIRPPLCCCSYKISCQLGLGTPIFPGFCHSRRGPAASGRDETIVRNDYRQLTSVVSHMPDMRMTWMPVGKPDWKRQDENTDTVHWKWAGNISVHKLLW